MTDLLLVHRDLPPYVSSHLQIIHDSGRALLAIVNNILDISKLNAHKTSADASVRVFGLVGPRGSKSSSAPVVAPTLTSASAPIARIPRPSPPAPITRPRWSPPPFAPAPSLAPPPLRPPPAARARAPYVYIGGAHPNVAGGNGQHVHRARVGERPGLQRHPGCQRPEHRSHGRDAAAADPRQPSRSAPVQTFPRHSFRPRFDAFLNSVLPCSLPSSVYLLNPIRAFTNLAYPASMPFLTPSFLRAC